MRWVGGGSGTRCGGGGGSSAEPHSAAERRADVKAVYRCEMRGEKFDFSARGDEFRMMLRHKQVGGGAGLSGFDIQISNEYKSRSRPTGRFRS
jgi:hypothetical protein